jgi:uncharacterized protein (DUF885 family)
MLESLSGPGYTNMRTLTLFLLLASSLAALAAPTDPPTVEARRKDLNQLLAGEWEYELREAPELATLIGDYRYNDRWSDFSLAHVQRQKQDLQQWVARFAAIDSTGFPEQEKLNQVLILRNLKERIEAIELKTFEMPVDQQDGVHLTFAETLTIIPFNTTRQYDDYLARLHALPRAFDQIIEILQQGLQDKLLPPRYLLEKAVAQCDDIAAPAGEANAFAQPLTHFPDAVPSSDRKRLHDAIIAAVEQEVRPAYRKLSRFLAQDYAPKGRAQEGIWALPNGDALYRFAIRQGTTTHLDPETIYQLGLKEVARIEDEQLAISRKLGFSDLKTFRASLKTNPKLIPVSSDQLLDAYRRYIAQMTPQLPRLFGLLPPTQLEVKPVEEFREKDAAGAEYTPGTPDGSRRGTVMINTGDYQHRSLVNVESTAYHEGVPGHHMQSSIAQTLPGLPTFRQQSGYNAYVEGWALYAESLGKDAGFYQDPYSDYGRLSSELLRAVRLVLDTGVHYKHWTRAQMVDYFHAHSSEDEPDVQSETDRYIAGPGQALGYKLGQLDILRLRQFAQKELGDRYDVRAFHDEILNGGALPLDVLDERVTAWISEQKSPPQKVAAKSRPEAPTN